MRPGDAAARAAWTASPSSALVNGRRSAASAGDDLASSAVDVKGSKVLTFPRQLLPNGFKVALHVLITFPPHEQLDPMVTRNWLCGAYVVRVDQYGLLGGRVGKHHELG